MPTTLSIKAPERGTYIVSAAFTDAAGEDVAPLTLFWTLSKMDGSIANDREDVEIETPAAAEDFVLSGLDLATDAYDLVRAFTVHGTYTSDEGVGLPLGKEILFKIEPAINIP